jgi:hypothetical protein
MQVRQDEGEVLIWRASSARDSRFGLSLSRLRIAVLCASGLAEESLCHLDVARHSDLRVSLQRFAE